MKEYGAKIFESSTCDKERRTKGIVAHPIDGGLYLQICRFPRRGVGLTFDDLNEINGNIFLDRDNAIGLANEIIRATENGSPDLTTYDLVPEAGWDNITPEMKLLFETDPPGV